MRWLVDNSNEINVIANSSISMNEYTQLHLQFV